MAYEISLAGKVALVTGGARGIGAGIARELAKAGADVCIGDVRPGADGPALVAELKASGRRAAFLSVDVSDRTQVDDLLERCSAELGPVDILVNNAVMSVRQDILQTRYEDFRKTLAVSVDGAFHVFQAVARQMVARGAKGSMIYISSPHAFNPYRGAIDYNTAKAAGLNMALSVANELVWKGIRVNMLEPGWTDTPGERTWYSDELLYGQGAQMPLGRLGTPEDLGKAAVFLASDLAAYVVGTTVKVNGGQLVGALPWQIGGRHGSEEQ